MATSTKLSVTQIAQLVLKAGFQGVSAVWAVAIALAESGGVTNARNTNSDGHCHSDDDALELVNDYFVGPASRSRLCQSRRSLKGEAAEQYGEQKTPSRWHQ